MESETIFDLNSLPTVTSLDAYEIAVEAFARGGSQRVLMERLFALGLPAGAVRWLAAYPGRTMIVREDQRIQKPNCRVL
jgi:hypothetical protein